MSEFRADPLTGGWVIIADGRSARPNEYATTGPPAATPAECPFCEGNESRTPPELAVQRAAGSLPNERGWTVRAIPNRFPTLTMDAESSIESGVAAMTHRPGRGHHEVVIESPRHAPMLPFLSDRQRIAVFRMFRDRVRYVTRQPEMGGVILFENAGPESGGTLWHPHAQLVATPFLPPRIATEAERMARYSRDHDEACLLEAQVETEREDGLRLVAEDDRFLALAPFASEHPCEVRIMPRRHCRSLADASDAEIDGLASFLPRILRALLAVVPNGSYNWFLHDGPLLPKDSNPFHWHLDVAPRLVRPDGFEVGSGIAVNPVTPESAASWLRTEYGRDAGLPP